MESLPPRLLARSSDQRRCQSKRRNACAPTWGRDFGRGPWLTLAAWGLLLGDDHYLWRQ